MLLTLAPLLHAWRNFRTVKARLTALCKLAVTYPWINPELKIRGEGDPSDVRRKQRER